MGTGRRLKGYRKEIEVYAVEPDDALHGLEGLKHMASSIVPDIYHPEELDGVLPISHRRGLGHLRAAVDRRGHPGRALLGRRRWRARCGSPSELAAAGKPGVIVTVFPDRADRYFEAPAARPRPRPAKETP